MTTDKESIPEWLKEIDLARATENIILGIVLFAGRYFKSIWQALFSPSAIQSNVLLNSEIKPLNSPKFSRPLTFLVVSGFFYLVAAKPSFGVPILVGSILDPLNGLIEQLPKKMEDLTLAKISAFMVPFVLFVALYSLFAKIVINKITGSANFKVQLNIHCYTAGLFATLMTFVATFEGYAWDFALSDSTSIFGAIVQVAYLLAMFGLGILILGRYVQVEIMATGEKWYRVIVSLLTAFLGYWVFVVPLMYLLSPLAERFK